ncbi:MAG: tetratricopeptide repeat protein [Bacteroidota bacterium]
MKRYLTLILFLALGTLLTQGFQCASPEMTTGNLALQNGEYVKAETSYEKELSKNPKNAEAWLKLYEAKMKLNKFEDAIKCVGEGGKYAIEPLLQKKAQILGYQTWVSCYNNAIGFINLYAKNKNKSVADSAIAQLKYAQLIRPENPEFVRLQGRMYEDLGDTVNFELKYKKYIEMYEKEMQFTKERQMFLNMSRNDVIAKIGNPVKSLGMRFPESDSTLTDLYKVSGDNVYLSFTEKPKGSFILDGFKINPPDYLMDDEKFQLIPFNIGPIASLAQMYFNKKDYKKSAEYVLLITQIDPNNVDANSFLIQIFDIQGKKEDALKQIGELVKTNPQNKFYLAQYGEIYFKMDSLDQAIIQYEKALVIDKNFSVVQRNVGACYKNKAVNIQKAQQDKKQSDPKYKPNIDEFLPLLNKSAAYFEKAKASMEYKNDFRVMVELANLYSVLDEKTKLNLVIADLERLESDIPIEVKEQYYLGLVKIYGDLKQNEKMRHALEEADKYKK